MAYAGGFLTASTVSSWRRPSRADHSIDWPSDRPMRAAPIGVMTDTPDSSALLNFQSDYDMTYPVVRANSDLMVSYNYPDALPTTFIYDRGGKQVFSHIGALRESDLDSLLGQLVAQN